MTEHRPGGATYGVRAVVDEDLLSVARLITRAPTLAESDLTVSQ